MTTNGDMTPRQPHEYEPLEQLPGDSFDLVDLVVAGITDAEVDDHLRKVLSGESPSTPRPRRLRWRQLSRH